MTTPPINAHVHFDTHPTHSSAATATLTGTRQDLAHGLLAAHGFEALDDHTLVMVRIDREEPYWAESRSSPDCPGDHHPDHRPAPGSD
ncbi:hypothetical protein ACFZCY_39040 [Streptomyces sp. NPDC007983]|uniref:hypothetical protein n=1 Tax=Streptomyces sp. NPDC007983 TaxID=3364800 RepID=UPI0036F0F777